MERSLWTGPDVPVRLEPGQSASWSVEAGAVEEGLRGHLLPSSMLIQGRVTLGNGKVVVSKKGARPSAHHGPQPAQII
jgi:hypothetical protein